LLGSSFRFRIPKIAMKTVSVIVPCRNERGHIEDFLEDVRRQRIPDGFKLEVVVADGASDDGAGDVLRAIEKKWAGLRVIANSGRIVSTGLNMAIRAASGSVIVRMDVHTRYARDYIEQNLSALDASGADCVGGPWTPRGGNYISTAIALVFDSWFVSGGGRAHSRTHEGPVDTVYLGCWKREAFDRFGYFDEALVRSQDNELNFRIRRAGGVIWQTPRIRSWYQPRSSMRNLFRQYVQYGYWKAHVLRKHGRPSTLRQLVAPVFVVSLGVLAVGAPFSSDAGLVLQGVLGCYAVMSVSAALVACRRPRHWRYLPVIPVLFGAHHLGFGYGYLRGLIDLFVLRRSPAASFGSLTRASRTAASIGSATTSF
jgi:glycosyltransferase involved in cell wall biosynthesis